ncbi:MAG: hypothetical protein ACR2IF_04430 [Terriglobales bacterium]
MARIFQVAYDQSLLAIRQEMLKTAGFDVVSAQGNQAAREMLSENHAYDLIVVGWSAGDHPRRDIVTWIKQRWPQLRVIALHDTRNHPIPDADYNSASENPHEWFEAVKSAAAAA